MGMKLWVDDVRQPPNSEWFWVQSVSQAIAVIYQWDKQLHDDTILISLDHDAGDFVEYGGDADYTLVGSLIEDRIVTKEGADCYYKLSMRLVNRRTDKPDWSGEKELRKVTKRPLVGF